jgi:hypothetical protein
MQKSLSCTTSVKVQNLEYQTIDIFCSDQPSQIHNGEHIDLKSSSSSLLLVVWSRISINLIQSQVILTDDAIPGNGT